MLTIQELTSPESIAALAPQWAELWAQTDATPFQHPAWLIPWTTNLWRGGKLFVLRVSDDNHLVAVAPLFQWGYPGTVQLSWLGAGITDYTDLLTSRGAEAAEAILDYLQKHGDWNIANLEEIRAGSPLLKLGLPAEPCSVCPVAALAAGIEDHLSTLDNKFRTDLRRAENRLRRSGELRIETNEPCLLDHLFRLHANRWHERGQDGVLGSARLQKFHRETAEAMQKAGLLRLYGLFLNDECIAVQYNLVAKGTAYAYLAGFDPAWGKSSPGAVLLKHSISAAIEEGVREFDFLRQPETFKYQWGAKDRPNYRLTLRRARVPKTEAA